MGNEFNENNMPVFENVAGEKRLHIRYDNVRFSEFERKVILENKCGSFLEMQCVCERNSIDIFYSCEGCREISEVIREEISSGAELFMVACAVLQAVKCCSDYLISPQELCLTPGFVYYSAENKKAELIYIPGYKSDMEVGEQIARMIGRVFEEESVQDMIKESVDRYIRKILEQEYGVSELIHITEEFIRSERLLSMPQIYENGNEKDNLYIKEEDKTYLNKESVVNIAINNIKNRIRSIIKEFIL